MTSLLLASFIAGFLTVLVPCMLPFLPIILGSSLTSSKEGVQRNPYRIIGALLVSIVLFTLLVEYLTSFIYIPTETWQYISAGLVLLVGLSFLFPSLWGRLPFMARLSSRSQRFLGKQAQQGGSLSDVFIGLSLGPLFSSCSPTYFLILAVVLPSNFFAGLFYILAYVVGLGVTLLFIALLGQTLVAKYVSATSYGNWLNRVLGIMMVLLAVAIFFGLTEVFETFLLDIGFIDVTQFELIPHTETGV